MSHSELRPEDITAIIDTREQTPWSLEPLKVERKTLTTGDYSVLGLEHEIAIERKSLPDLLGCIGNSRKRFEEELERLHAYPARCVIIECSYQEFDQGAWLMGLGQAARSKVAPSAAMGSVLSWMGQGMPFLFCPTPTMASSAAARFLFLAARKRFRELTGFYKGLKISS